MNGPEHYREAESQIACAQVCTQDREAYHLGLAQVHAILALTAATVEAADHGIDTNLVRPLVMRPIKADPDIGEPAFPGTPWGRALHGEVSA